MAKYNSLIIGAGQMGALYDNPQSSNILTHAHAYKENSDFELSGFVDVDFQKASEAAKLWNTKAYKNIKEAFVDKNIDVISLAVPDEFHYETIKALDVYNLKLIIAEKPLAKTVSEANEILNAVKTPILVNYSRRFVPEFIELKTQIKRGDFGDFISGYGYYGKGLLHNGSHLIDLIRFLIGEIEDFIPLGHNYDFYSDDPSVDTILKLKNGADFYAKNIDCSLFTIFEADFIFEKARIKIINLGNKFEIFEVKESDTFKGYRNLVKTEEINTQLLKSMYYVVDNAYNYLSGKEEILCTVNDGYKALEICIEIMNKAIKK